MGKLMEKSMETNLEEKMAQIKENISRKDAYRTIMILQNLNADMKS